MSSRNNDNSNNAGFNLRRFFEKDRLNGENFTNWERMLRLILKSEGREDVIDTPLPVLPENPTNAQRQRHKEILDRVVCTYNLFDDSSHAASKIREHGCLQHHAGT